MARQVSLSVNDVPIKLDYFVQEYIGHVSDAILASLRDTEAIGSLELSIGNEGEVTINLNGSVIPLKYFPVEIIRSTVLGMVAPLKGVDEVNRLQLNVSG